MKITVQLPIEMEADLRARLDRTGAALSEFVREAIAEKLKRELVDKPSAYDLGRHLFGKHGSGRHDLSSKRKVILDERVQAKHYR